MFHSHDKFKRTIALPKLRVLLTALVGILVGYSVSLPTSAAEVKQTVAGGGAEDSATFYTFPQAPHVAISRHGNLVRFEGPTGYDHIGIGAFSEGYVLCYAATNAYDIGDSEFGFGPSAASCSGMTCTVTRTTTDGKLQLKQVITKNPAADKSVTFVMTLKNLTGASIGGVVLRRQVDFDVDTGGSLGTGDFENWFASTDRDAAFAWNNPTDHASEDHAMILRHYKQIPLSLPRIAKVTDAILDTSCNPTNIAADGPVFGDYGGTIQYNVGTLGGGKSVELTTQYLRN